MTSDKYIQINDEGFFVFDGQIVQDEEAGQQLLENLEITDKGVCVTEYQGHKAFIEATDEALVVKQIHKEDGFIWTAQASYNYKFKFSLDLLTLDEWDRFHGVDNNCRPFVFSRSAQADFFNLVDEFDDDSITYQGKKITIPHWLRDEINVEQNDFWSDIYKTEDPPGWDLGKPAYPLPEVLPQLKLNRSRVLVIGCGNGHDAAHFAEQGHIVTGIDLAEEGITQARKNYGHLKDLNFEQADVFNLPEKYYGQFDIVFEHTLYCAINPERRNELIKIWSRCLSEDGHLLGVFFIMNRNLRPPFGGSEWELKKRLDKGYKPLYWTRWRKSEDWRKGAELVVYAQKRRGEV